MSKTPRYALDPDTQAETIGAIVALDWSTDPVTQPLRIIQQRFGVDEERAIALFLHFQSRSLIVCRPERVANNMAETGIVMPVIRSRWIQPDETMQ
jgi:hypothetical protein